MVFTVAKQQLLLYGSATCRHSAAPVPKAKHGANRGRTRSRLSDKVMTLACTSRPTGYWRGGRLWEGGTWRWRWMMRSPAGTDMEGQEGMVSWRERWWRKENG